MKIAVVGCGYVGMSLATLMSERNDVVCVDVLQERVRAINNRIAPIREKMMEEFLKTKELSLKATSDLEEAVTGADVVIVAVPTNYDDAINRFDTSIVDGVCERALEYLKLDAFIVIKSTIPIGYTKSISEKLGTSRIIFSPEFLREGKALYDNLHPSRIVVGTNGTENQRKYAETFEKLLRDISEDEETRSFIMGSTEAEALKLFANTYLAMRVAFFNELDMFAESHDLSAKEIIDGVCSDPRIGNFYNNPSFGYGGYCLPKDSKQLYRSYEKLPQRLMESTITSNEARKQYIMDQIWNRLKASGGKTIGIYRLTMKNDSDNFRSAAIIDIMDKLTFNKNIIKSEIIIYEPTCDKHMFHGHLIITDLDEFKKRSDIIVTNRFADELSDVMDKVYTRDIFGEN